MDEITLEITFAVENAAKIYSESPATTNAAVILSVIGKLIPVSFLVKLFAHKLNGKS
jgi:hypothetical protein